MKGFPCIRTSSCLSSKHIKQMPSGMPAQGTHAISQSERGAQTSARAKQRASARCASKAHGHTSAHVCGWFSRRADGSGRANKLTKCSRMLVRDLIQEAYASLFACVRASEGRCLLSHARALACPRALFFSRNRAHPGRLYLCTYVCVCVYVYIYIYV